ncbi:histidine kinase [Streptomyces sp. GC420]|uniref:sensor histidine kinase n=1 Tax=Streptomyces sp. GC420 TaxID=2697568 RepID=UPI0028BED2DD|nr:histidine kinase [Streptomyces sp. GC420]
MRLLGAPGPWLVDTVLAVAFLVVALTLGGQPEPGPGWRALDAEGAALTCLVNVPIAARRRAPLAVFAVACAGWLVFIHLHYWPVVNCPGPFLALYTVAARRPTRVATAATAVIGAVWLYAGIRSGQPMAACVAQALVFPAVGCRVGIAARISAERAEQLARLAVELRREQGDRARRAVAGEQRRIARELHDVVAHHMSVINVQAGMAGYVFRTSPDTAHQALLTISETSQEALRELRRMLTLLRSSADETADTTVGADAEEGTDTGPGSTSADGSAVLYAPMPGLDRLPEVADRVRAAGVPVDLRFSGDVRPLEPGTELCAYRVVQEALTNVIKHAHPARATVLVDFRPREIVVSVTDDGRQTRRVSANVPPGPGHGLIGMRERAKLYGGTVEAGPRAEGGYGVRLVLPTAPAPTEPTGG